MVDAFDPREFVIEQQMSEVIPTSSLTNPGEGIGFALDAIGSRYPNVEDLRNSIGHQDIINTAAGHAFNFAISGGTEFGLTRGEMNDVPGYEAFQNGEEFEFAIGIEAGNDILDYGRFSWQSANVTDGIASLGDGSMQALYQAEAAIGMDGDYFAKTTAQFTQFLDDDSTVSTRGMLGLDDEYGFSGCVGAGGNMKLNEYFNAQGSAETCLSSEHGMSTDISAALGIDIGKTTGLGEDGKFVGYAGVSTGHDGVLVGTQYNMMEF